MNAPASLVVSAQNTPPPETLHGKRVFIAEDNYLVGDELAQKLKALGAEVVGPANTIDLATRLTADGEVLDGAILDVHLQGEFIYNLADRLYERRVPIVFMTGYDARMISARYHDVPICEKPIDEEHLRLIVGRFVG